MTNHRHKQARKATIVGFISNLVLTLFKVVAGVVGNSSAMIADAANSASDLGTDLVVLTSLKVSSRPKDQNHKYGHGKIETLATGFIGGVLLLVGLGLIFSSSKAIYGHFAVEPLARPGLIALYAGILSMVLKEVLFKYTMRIGKKYNSKVVVANAWHHRSDVYASMGTVVGIAGAIFLEPRWVILDPIAAIVVSFFILKVAFKIVRETVSELIETSLPSNIEAEIIELTDSVKGIHEPHSLKTRHIGNDIAIEMHVFVDPEMNVNDAHDLTLEVEGRLYERFGQDTYISIHVEPLEKCQNKGKGELSMEN